jgi:dipeptidyl aminopeptidase/acylaminoacyl peptidase
MRTGRERRGARLRAILGSLLLAGSAAAQVDVFTLDHVSKIRAVEEVAISPSGDLVVYVLRVPRVPYEEEDGPAWAELHVAGPAGTSRPFVAGKVNVSEIAWTPDGRGISFLAKRGEDEKKCLYVIPADGGEARQVRKHAEDVEAYSWSPDGRLVAFLAKEKEGETKEKLRKKGFEAEVYEEEGRPVKVWIAERDAPEKEATALDLPGSASELRWAPKGDLLALALAPTPRIDDEYMRRKIHVVDVSRGAIVATVDNPGKLKGLVWSPDGEHLAFVSAADLHDPLEGRLFVAPAKGGAPRDLLPDFEGHVQEIDWLDADTLVYVGHVGLGSVFGRVDLDGGGREMLVASGGPVLRSASVSRETGRIAFVADHPTHPEELFVLARGGEPVRWTRSNPWMEALRLAPQEAMAYAARDGLRIEGVLVRPLEVKPGERRPLVLVVHGGPEDHFSNGWMTSYSRPAQVFAARGFAVFFPNYRGSTGRGVAFSKLGQADYGGREFDDLVDAIEPLVASGLVDRAKVGITGGSYGGFAAAWGATKLTEHFAASVMLVGISDQIAKAGTTDIPNEMHLVHSRRWPWEHWDWFHERSPITYVEQARTPILILHGKDDTRVHPSQSLELYRYLKLIGKTPVRLVLYPGEGHGNRKAASRLDYSMRLVRWMEHYLKGPGGEPPPTELEHDLERLEGPEGKKTSQD